MADDQRNVTFNIDEQTGVNTNVAGDMTVYGGQQYVAGSPEEVRADLAALREVVAGLGLQPEVQQEATDLIDEADRELAQPKPQPEKVGGPLTRLTNLLADVGGGRIGRRFGGRAAPTHRLVAGRRGQSDPRRARLSGRFGRTVA